MENLGIRVLFMGNNFLRLMGGLWITIRISLISVGLSVVLGLAVGLLMTRKSRVLRFLTAVYLETVRILPQLVLLFLAYFGLTKAFGINLEAETAAVLVFTFWGTAEMGDLVRGALISIPKHQYESAWALGLSKGQTYISVIIPQIVRRLIPLSINLATRMIKTTSLIVLIGVVEVMKTAQQIIEANRYTVPDSALWIYGTIFLLYFLCCWPISCLAAALEKRWRA